MNQMYPKVDELMVANQEVASKKCPNLNQRKLALRIERLRIYRLGQKARPDIQFVSQLRPKKRGSKKRKPNSSEVDTESESESVGAAKNKEKVEKAKAREKEEDFLIGLSDFSEDEDVNELSRSQTLGIKKRKATKQLEKDRKKPKLSKIIPSPKVIQISDEEDGDDKDEYAGDKEEEGSDYDIF